MAAERVETSIVIRTKNESRWIGTVLKKLFEQTYQDFEVVIIDSGSTDKTLEIVKKFPIKLVQIPSQDFSYPYALNQGIKRSSASKYIVIIAGHSLPTSRTWLADGLENFEQFEKLLGVYGYIKPLPDSTLWDKAGMTFWNWLSYLITPARKHLVSNSTMGTLGFTNAVILKSLWLKRPFNEAFGAGGEDGEWASYWMQKGYKAIKDRKFTVMHSHYLGLLGWIQQWLEWFSLSKPQAYKPLAFRKSATHS